MQCRYWAVTTTIFGPTEAVRRFLYKTNWCVVIVGDQGKPTEYQFKSTMGDNMIFLSDKDQMAIGSPFVDALAWNTLGRKNVGYLYAVAQGAPVIFDLDDDNILKFFLKEASPDPMLDIDKIIGMVLDNKGIS